jgi:hypothetical protein
MKTSKATKAIATILRSGEQTEDHVRAACLERGVSDVEREDAIGELLDAGAVLPTLIQADGLGLRNRRFVPALRLAAGWVAPWAWR